MDTEALIKANIPLIKKIATKFYNAPFEDLFQAGCMGVIKAYKNYQENGMTKFSTYAYDYIFGEMYECVYKNQNIKISKEYLRLKRKIDIAKNSLSAKYNRLATVAEVANFLGIDEKLIYEVINMDTTFVSLDDDRSEKRCLYEVIPDKESISLDDKISLQEGIKTLNKDEQKIINYRYFKDYAQGQIARKLNMTQVMVSRYEKKSLEKLRSYYDVV